MLFSPIRLKLRAYGTVSTKNQEGTRGWDSMVVQQGKPLCGTSTFCISKSGLGPCHLLCCRASSLLMHLRGST